jgi:protein-tyrosine-phosphatase
MQTILFLCPHGGAKSVIAASYFNRIATQCDLPFVAVAAAAEDPYDAVPAPVADLLEREGFDVRDFQPRPVTPDDVANAAQVIRIEEHWNVPMVSVDLHGSAAAIRERVEALAAELHG